MHSLSTEFVAHDKATKQTKRMAFPLSLLLLLGHQSTAHAFFNGGAARKVPARSTTTTATASRPAKVALDANGAPRLKAEIRKSGPRVKLPSFPSHLALPALSYTGLAGITAGTLHILQPLAWQGAALVGWCVGAPFVIIITQLALSGGSGIATAMGGKQTDDAKLQQIANDAAKAVGVPPPTVFEINSREPNAFAASGLMAGDPTVAVTTGLREVLSETELAAVLAHEMGHLRHRDVLRNMHVAAAAAGMGGIYEVGRTLLNTDSDRSSSRRKKKKSKDGDGDSTATLGLALMAGGLATQGAAHGLRLMASRNAEIKADRAAAAAYGADTMINALRKISAAAASRPADLRQHKTAKNFAFAMISAGPEAKASPRHELAAGRLFARLGEALSTHPTLEKRVHALEQAAAAGLVPQRGGGSSWFF